MKNWKKFVPFILILILVATAITGCATTNTASSSRPFDPATAPLTQVQIAKCEMPDASKEAWLSRNGDTGVVSSKWVDAQSSACREGGNPWILILHERAWYATTCFNDLKLADGKITSAMRFMPLPDETQLFNVMNVGQKHMGWILHLEKTAYRYVIYDSDSMKTLIWLTRLFGQMGDDRKTEEYQQQARAEQPVRPRRHRLLQAPLRRAQGGKEEDQDDAVRATRGKTLQDHHEHGQKEVTHCTSYRAIAKKCSAVLYRSLIWISTSLDILALTIFRAAE